jgi:photosystem II stability/assembly factor-like uncharacterized protein
VLVDLWADGPELYAVGNQGALRVSRDGGLSWEEVLTNAPGSLAGVFGRPKGARFALGQQGAVLKSSDQGRTWEASTVGSPGHTWMAGVAAGRYLVIVGLHGAIARSLDEGLSWEIIDSGTRAHLAAVAVGPKGLYAVGQRGTVLFSRDGARWVSVEVPTRNDLFAVSQGPDGALYLAGAAGTVLEGAFTQYETQQPRPPTSEAIE